MLIHMTKLHPVQQKLITLLKETIDNPLTMNELKDELGVSSTSVIFHHIQQLEKKGFLRRNPSNPRDYQILSDNPEKLITYINLYGLAACSPNGSILDGDPIERIPIASKLIGFASDEAFMVKAKGDSMSPRIHEGDLVLAKKSLTANSGDIVVCVNKGETLIKKLQSGAETILISLNSKFEPFVASEDFRIEGIVRGVLSYKMSS